MAKPILLAVHDDGRDREVLERALTTRYSDGYQIICECVAAGRARAPEGVADSTRRHGSHSVRRADEMTAMAAPGSSSALISFIRTRNVCC